MVTVAAIRKHSAKAAFKQLNKMFQIQKYHHFLMQVQNALYPGLGGSFHGGGLDIAALDPDDIRNFIDDEAGQFTLEIHNRDAAQAVVIILGEPETAAQ